MPFQKPTIDEAIAKNPARGRTVMIVDGGDKDGKTTFALTMPEPYWIINTNFGLAGLPAYQDAVRRGVVQVADHAMPDEFVLDHYEKVMKAIQSDYNDALASAEAAHGTVIVDKTDEVWGMVSPVMKNEAERRRYEEWEKGPKSSPFKKMQTDYQDPNLWMRSFYVRPLQGGREHVNVAFVQGAKREWKSDGSGPTGKLLYHGFQEGPGLVQAHVRISTTEPQPILTNTGAPTGKYTKSETQATILLCRFDRAVQGFVLAEPNFKSFLEALDD